MNIQEQFSKNISMSDIVSVKMQISTEIEVTQECKDRINKGLPFPLFDGFIRIDTTNSERLLTDSEAIESCLYHVRSIPTLKE
jgi:hypothetical protein